MSRYDRIHQKKQEKRQRRSREKAKRLRIERQERRELVSHRRIMISRFCRENGIVGANFDPLTFNLEKAQELVRQLKEKQIDHGTTAGSAGTQAEVPSPTYQ